MATGCYDDTAMTISEAGGTDSSSDGWGVELPTTQIARPESVALCGDELVYDLAGRWRRVHDRHLALDAFVVLHKAPPKQYLKFARRYGLLELCPDDLPWYHPHFPMTAEWWPKGGYLCTRRHHLCHAPQPNHSDHVSGEPIAAWRKMSGEAADLLDVAAALRKRVTPPKAAVDRLRDPRFPGEKETAWDLVRSRVNWWLLCGQLTPQLKTEPPQPRLVVGVFGLYNELALQLARAVAGTGRWAQCSVCQEVRAVRGKMPQRGRSWFCSKKCREDGNRERWSKAQRKARTKARRAGPSRSKAPTRVRKKL